MRWQVAFVLLFVILTIHTQSTNAKVSCGSDMHCQGVIERGVTKRYCDGNECVECRNDDDCVGRKDKSCSRRGKCSRSLKKTDKTAKDRRRR